jgi:hypothetical protein
MGRAEDQSRPLSGKVSHPQTAQTTVSSWTQLRILKVAVYCNAHNQLGARILTITMKLNGKVVPCLIRIADLSASHHIIHIAAGRYMSGPQGMYDYVRRMH